MRLAKHQGLSSGLRVVLLGDSRDATGVRLREKEQSVALSSETSAGIFFRVVAETAFLSTFLGLSVNRYESLLCCMDECEIVNLRPKYPMFKPGD